MSSGALVQLAAVGQMNEYLTICPETTFFKGTYQRYTNFSRVPIEQTFMSATGFGRRQTATIQRSGDLIVQSYLVMNLSAFVLPAEVLNPAGVLVPIDPVTDTVYWTNEVGHAAIEQVEVTIGGQMIDLWYGDFLAIWENVSHKAGKRLGSLVGFFTDVADLIVFSQRDQILYVPMMFWFNRCTEQALPLIALQYHEVKYDVRLRARTDLIIFTGNFDPAVNPANAVTNQNTVLNAVGSGELTDCYFLVNFVYLDTMERRIFATNAHDYLFDQLQFTGIEAKPAGKTIFNLQLFFNHVVSEMYWVIQRNTAIDDNRWFDFSGVDGLGAADPLADPLVSAKIQLNSHDLFTARDPIYFRKVVPWETHSHIPDYYIYLFSFALDPENWKPTGGVNVSRIDNVILRLETQDFEGQIRTYARSKNILKIISGMAGVKYAN